MRINYKKNEIDVDENLCVSIGTLYRVGNCNISLLQVSIDFVYADGDDLYLFYENDSSYRELIEVMAGHPEIVGTHLKRYADDYGIEHKLWKQLLKKTIDKYKINKFTYIGACGFYPTSDYISFNYDKEYLYPRKVDSNYKTYQLLTSILPENYDKTKRMMLNEELKARLDEYTKACGAHYENSSLYFQRLKDEFGDCNEKWGNFKNNINGLKDYIINGGFVDQDEYKEALSFFDDAILFAGRNLSEILKSQLYQQYGTVIELKNNLRGFINKLSFMELLDVFKEYKNKEKVVEAQIRRTGIDTDNECMAYVNVFRLGSILISDRMNHLNKNKAKNKYIPQELIDEALIFYYDTPTARDAQTARIDEKYIQDKESGDKGEERVEYALKWLDKSFIQIEKRSKDRVGNSCIILLNKEFIDEKQEYDHIVVSPKGIFCIETKNYNGKLIIDSQGNWIRRRNGEEEGIRNPLQQIRQHEKVLKSFLPATCNIVSLICIANDNAVIEGAENCTIPIIKCDMIVEYIENNECKGIALSEGDVESCVKAIYNHMV